MGKTFQNACPRGAVFRFQELVDYAPNGIVSKQLSKTKFSNITLFAFDTGQSLTEHVSPYDALVQVIEGEIEIFLGGKPLVVGSGEALLMPADVPHALQALTRSKMLLVMIKDPPATYSS